MKKVAIYSRVSTKDQTCEQQMNVLRDYCSRKGYEIFGEYVDEGLSAFKKNRPAYAKILEDARLHKFDFILVFKLDRFGRSLKELLNTMDFLKSCRIGFISYSEKEFDTTTSVGELMFNIVACFANFERSLISERTKLKLQYLKSIGVKLGPPVKVDQKKALELRAAGKSLREIGKELGVHRSSVSKTLKTHRLAVKEGEGLGI